MFCVFFFWGEEDNKQTKTQNTTEETFSFWFGLFLFFFEILEGTRPFVLWVCFLNDDDVKKNKKRVFFLCVLSFFF